MNPIDEAVGKEDEERELEVIVHWERRFVELVVELGVAFDLEDKADGGEKGHGGHGRLCLLDFHPYLIPEVFRVLKGGLVKDEKVGKRCADEVEDDTKQPEDVSTPKASRQMSKLTRLSGTTRRIAAPYGPWTKHSSRHTLTVETRSIVLLAPTSIVFEVSE